MQIKRDYSESFFGDRRTRRRPLRTLFYLIAFISLSVALVVINYDRVEMVAMDVIGIAPTPTPFPSELATQASNLTLTGDLIGAAELWESVVRQRPDNINYLYEYGELLIDLNNYDLAEQLGERIIEIDLTDPRGYALRANALVFDDSESEAVSVAVIGLDYDETYAPLYASLARGYVGTARYADAVDAGLRAVELAPYDADARRAYAFALSWFGENLEATSQLEQAIALDPNRIPTYFELAFQYLAQNRDQEAIDIYNLILAVQPRNARAMLRLCTAYRKIGEFNRALGYCTDARENADIDDAIYADAQFEFGRMVYNETGDWATALDAFEACSDAAPESLSCTYYQGLTHYYLGNCDEAWSILRDSLTMARARSNTEGAVEDIEAGFQAITQTCPNYAGLGNTLDLDLNPQPTEQVGGS